MNQERLMMVLLSPVVSEKAALAAEAQQYAFRVATDATKREIGRAVETLFNVEVAGVQVVNVKGKKKRFSQRFGTRQDWRKAYVRLKTGHSIDFGGGA
ncbi:MAG TPA: 50S ribosomal protein L23 [Lamprocystis sp. (in: g-proteobacteria)]|nr:50S ribosomal protein L23 [Lamprocystis sp. (in: g-proteobacteria)]